MEVSRGQSARFKPGYSWNAEVRAKISKALAGRTKSDAHRKALAQAGLGKTHSEETRQKMSRVRKGRDNGRSGTRLSGKTRAKMRAAQQRRYADSAQREAQAERMRARWARDVSHRPETIEKMKRRRSEQVSPLQDTKPELLVQKLLKRQGVRFRKHAIVPGLGRHQWDLVLVDVRLLIEVDGCYWHGCQICCPNSTIGKANANRDKKLDNAAKKAGWTVIRLWEHELKNKFIRIGKMGVFENVT